MSANFCPECGEELPADSINLAEGVALCARCGSLSRLSEVASHRRPITEVLSRPPSGCSIVDRGHDIVVRASLRSIGGFFGMLFLCLFWNGIVSVFVLIALAGLYMNLIGPLPAWFPAPQMNDLTLGMTLFLCLFLTPFVTIGSLLIGALLLSIAGRIEVAVDNAEANVRTGIGWLCWRRRFNPALVRSVDFGTTSWESNGQPRQLIVIEADRTIKFGSLLPDDKRQWLQAALHALLATEQGKRHPALVIEPAAPRF
jgi:hypothetical protein